MAWLLTEGGPAVQARLLRDIAPAVPALRDVLEAVQPEGLATLPYGSRAGWHLLGQQGVDGQWPAGWLTVPPGSERVGVGTIPAYRRLLELGWDPEIPSLQVARRGLFRLLAEDLDWSVMGELTPQFDDEDQIRHGRRILREAAAAALAQSGHEDDPRLRGAARRLVQRVNTFLKSPLAAKPWVRLGNQHVLDADAAPPSFHLLVMLAYMPTFRSEHAEFMERLYEWLSQPWPRQAAVQLVGEVVVQEQPQLALGDYLATRTTLDGDIVSALAWLEIMARLGFLNRHEGWTRLLDRMLGDRDRRGVWTPPRSVEFPAQVPVWSWPVAPLFDAGWEAADRGWSLDVTFRLLLIAQLAGRELLLG